MYMYVYVYVYIIYIYIHICKLFFNGIGSVPTPAPVPQDRIPPTPANSTIPLLFFRWSPGGRHRSMGATFVKTF